jgi:hypothetical protein
MKAAQINLDIEELVLRNLPYAQRYRIAAAIEEELTRLFSEHGLPPELVHGGNTDINVPQIIIDALSVTEGMVPSMIGARIAQSMHRTLSTPSQDGVARTASTLTNSHFFDGGDEKNFQFFSSPPSKK